MQKSRSGRVRLRGDPTVRLTARGESLAAFGRRCIPAGCVAPPSNTPGILGRRALPAGRIVALGATPDFHHGLLALTVTEAACAPADGMTRIPHDRGEPIDNRVV